MSCWEWVTYQIQQQIINYKQVQSSISIYYTQIKGFEDEYDAYVALSICYYVVIQKILDMQKQDWLVWYLMGLNESYKMIHNQILLLDGP